MADPAMPWDLPAGTGRGFGGSRVRWGMGDAPYPASSHPFPGLFLQQRGMIPVHDRAGSHLRTPGMARSIQQRRRLG